MDDTHKNKNKNKDKDKPVILVIGGTGMLGRPVVQRLAQDGNFRVRVLSRRAVVQEQEGPEEGEESSPTIEYVQGNILDDESSLLSAMKDCIGVHINLSGGGGGGTEQLGAERVAQAALQIPTLRRISLISGITTNAENAKRFPNVTRAKYMAEQAIIQAAAASAAAATATATATATTHDDDGGATTKSNDSRGFSYAIFRCTMFLESLPTFPYWISTTSSKTTRNDNDEDEQQHLPKWHWLAADDYARLVVNSYRRGQEDGWRRMVESSSSSSSSPSSSANQIFILCGPGPPRSIPEAIYQVYLPRRRRQQQQLLQQQQQQQQRAAQQQEEADAGHDIYDVYDDVPTIPRWWAWMLQWLPPPWWPSVFTPRTSTTTTTTTTTTMTRAEWSAYLAKMDWLSQIHEEMGDFVVVGGAIVDDDDDATSPTTTTASTTTRTTCSKNAECLGDPPSITMEQWIDDYLLHL